LEESRAWSLLSQQPLSCWLLEACASARTLLVLGDGDLSFSLALARLLASASARPRPDRQQRLLLLATTLDSREALQRRYGLERMSAVWAALDDMSTRDGGSCIRVLDAIDATALVASLGRHGLHVADDAIASIDLVVWQFPHPGGKNKPCRSRALLRACFQSVRQLAPRASVLMTLARGQGGTPIDLHFGDRKLYAYKNSWQIVEQAASASYTLARLHPFDAATFDGYRSSGRRETAQSFHTSLALSHVFQPALHTVHELLADPSRQLAPHHWLEQQLALQQTLPDTHPLTRIAASVRDALASRECHCSSIVARVREHLLDDLAKYPPITHLLVVRSTTGHLHDAVREWMHQHVLCDECSFEWHQHEHLVVTAPLSSDLAPHFDGCIVARATHLASEVEIDLDLLAAMVLRISDARVLHSPSFEQATITAPPSLFAPVHVHDVSFWILERDAFTDTLFRLLVWQLSLMNAVHISLIDQFEHPTTRRLSRCYRIIYKALGAMALDAKASNALQDSLRELLARYLPIELRGGPTATTTTTTTQVGL